MSFLQKIRDLFRPDEPDTPDTPIDPLPVPKAQVSVLDYARIVALLRSVAFERIWPALLSVPVILFFTGTGILVWFVLIISLICRVFCWGFGC